MSEGGVFAVDRGVFEHPMFAPEPYTEREAWLWLIGTAAWKPTKVRPARAVISLARGQLAFSERFLAEKWKWSKSKVHRYLVRLKIESMVDLQTDHETNLITICNYDDYQFGGIARGPQNEPQTEPAADQPRTKEEETKKLRIYDDGGDAPEPSVRQSACDLADEIAVAIGYDLAFVPPTWCGAANRVEMWLTNGWPRELILETVRAVMSKKRDGPPESINYFEKPIAKAVASLARPLPTVVVDNTPESVHVRATENKSTSRSLEGILARLEDFDAPGGGGGARPPDVRMLSKG